MKALNTKLLRKFLNLAGDSLEGKWLLVGGTLLPALGLDVRSTIDIDLIGLGEKEAKQSIQLMELAERLGLSVESINQAAAFFLNKIKYTKNDLLILHEGKKATIYRPSLELYWKLKTKRLSDSDALDCKHYYDYCIKQKDSVDFKKLSLILKSALTSDLSPEKRELLKNLESLLA